MFETRFYHKARINSFHSFIYLHSVMDTPKPKPNESPEPPAKVLDKGLEPWAKVLALATILSWIFLFGYGLVIDTEAHRVKITRLVAAMADTTTAAPSGSEIAKTDTTTAAAPGAQTDAPEEHEDATAATLFFLGSVVFFFYTPTNLALLCMLAGLMGALGRGAHLHPMGNLNKRKQPRAEQEVALPFDAINPYLSGIIRGFFVYIILISGSLILFDNPFTNPTADGYARLAGMLSLLSFIMSYNPLIYGSVFTRIDKYLNKKLQDTQPESDPREPQEDILRNETPIASSSEEVSGDADSGLNGQFKPVDRSLNRLAHAPNGKASHTLPKLLQRQAEEMKNT